MTLKLKRSPPLMAGALASVLGLLLGCGGGNDGLLTTPAAATQAAAGMPATDGSASAGSAAVESAGTYAAVDQTAQSASRSSELSAAAAPSAVAGAVYYLDSRLGNDANNGLAATPGTNAAGPWRSLARLKAASLLPGDSVRLVCGSVWTETLALAASGASGNPITVAAYPAGCAARPVITGATTIGATQWSLYRGNIYKASLSGAPSQVLSTAGTMALAHHPNRGRDAADPSSIYLRLAADADTLLLNNRPVSSYMVTGADLVLPAGTTLGAGTQVRIRSNAWTIEEKTVSAVLGSKLSLSTATAYPLKAGWGYYLVGQLWMLDEPGEWYYDAVAKTLYAWMPDSRAPGATLATSRLATGVDLEARRYVTLDGLVIRAVGTGLNLKGGLGLVVRNSVVEDTLDYGANASNSQGTLIEASAFSRTGNDAISGHDEIVPSASGMRVENNVLTDSGVVMAGQAPVSLPRRARAAIRPGANATVAGNSISNTAYIGIWPLANSTVSGNVVAGTCTVLDDCGAIYVSGANNNSIIAGNLVLRSRGALAGKSPAAAYTQAQGIYLDDYASGVRVLGNTVTDADSGIQLHVASNNTVSGNKLYGNRNNQLWLQENHNDINPLGDLAGNTITANQIAATSATARGIYLDTVIKDTSRFGSFDQNRYLDSVYPLVAEERTPLLATRYTLPEWRSASTAGVARGLDANGSGTSQTRFASVLMNGNNIVPNGQLSADTAGWTTWNETKPLGSLMRLACAPGWCARYAAGASPGILSSPNFSTSAGTWYRLSFDANTGADNQLLSVVVRRGGGGSNGYESLSDRSLDVTANRSWKRYSVVFKATKTIHAADPLSKDLGARVDFQNIAPGNVVIVANLELLPIVPAETLTRSEILVNPGNTAIQVNCPSLATQPSLCAIYARLSDNLPVSWPAYLGPRSADILYTRDARLVDSDGDGIPDSQDACAGTAAGQAVNGRGCALGQ